MQILFAYLKCTSTYLLHNNPTVHNYQFITSETGWICLASLIVIFIPLIVHQIKLYRWYRLHNKAQKVCQSCLYALPSMSDDSTQKKNCTDHC